MDESSESEVYEVEKIIEHRKKGRSVKLYVRWKGYGEEENSWEPLKNLSGCHELVEEYARSNSDFKSLLSGQEHKPIAGVKRKRAKDTEPAKSGQSSPVHSPHPKRPRHPSPAPQGGDCTGGASARGDNNASSVKTSPVPSKQPANTADKVDKAKIRGRKRAGAASTANLMAVEKTRKNMSPSSSMPTPSHSPQQAAKSSGMLDGTQLENQMDVSTSVGLSAAVNPGKTPPSQTTPVKSNSDSSKPMAHASSAPPDQSNGFSTGCHAKTPTDDTKVETTSVRRNTQNTGHTPNAISQSQPANSSDVPLVNANGIDEKEVKPVVKGAADPEQDSGVETGPRLHEEMAQPQCKEENMNTDEENQVTPEQVQPHNVRSEVSPNSDNHQGLPNSCTQRVSPKGGNQQVSSNTDHLQISPNGCSKSPVDDIMSAGPGTDDRAVAANGSKSCGAIEAKAKNDMAMLKRVGPSCQAVADVPAGHATPGKKSCVITPASNHPTARTPGVVEVFQATNSTPPLWKAPTSSAEQTQAYLTVDAVQQLGSLRQPNSSGSDTFTENWVNSLVGVKLLEREETINKNIEALDHPEKKKKKATVSPCLKLPASNAPSSSKSRKTEQNGKPTPIKKAEDVVSDAGSSSEGLDLPFGTAIHADKENDNADFDFDEYEDSEIMASSQNKSAVVDMAPDALATATMEGNVSVLRAAALHKVNLNHIVDSKGATLLITAVQYGQEEVVQFLLEEVGGDINMQPHNGETPLMIAAQRNRHSICMRLVRAGAQLDAQSLATQESALIMACKRDHMKVVDVLLRSSSDLSVTDARDMTAMDHVRASSPSLEARIKKHSSRMTEYLLSAVSARVQLEGTPEQPALLGFHSFGAPHSTAYRFVFDFTKTASPVNIRLFLLRGRLKQDGAGMRLAWVGNSTVTDVCLNKEEVKPQVKQNMYQLWPCLGKNEVTVKLDRLGMTNGSLEKGPQPVDRIFACIYNLVKHK
eukprot:scpid13903/ scgid6390/ 